MKVSLIITIVFTIVAATSIVLAAPSSENCIRCCDNWGLCPCCGLSERRTIENEIKQQSTNNLVERQTDLCGSILEFYLDQYRTKCDISCIKKGLAGGKCDANGKCDCIGPKAIKREINPESDVTQLHTRRCDPIVCPDICDINKHYCPPCCKEKARRNLDAAENESKNEIKRKVCPLFVPYCPPGSHPSIVNGCPIGPCKPDSYYPPS